MMDIIFEWDEQKNASNKVKHGIKYKAQYAGSLSLL